MRRNRLAGILVSALAAMATAQGSRADYERAASRNREPYEILLGARVEMEWSSDGATLWYNAVGDRLQRRWMSVDLESGAKSEPFDTALLAEKVRAHGYPLPEQGSWVTRLEPTSDGAWALLFGSDQAWWIEFEPFDVTPFPLRGDAVTH